MKIPFNNHSKTVMGVAAAALAVVMATAASREDDATTDIAQPVSQRERPTVVATAPAYANEVIPLERLKRARSKTKTVNLFSAKSWYVPPPPPPPAPPPLPSAPPLPFTFLGTVRKPDGNLTIFLSGKDRVYLVKEGDTIDATYHVDGVKNGQLALTYLPLRVQQYLNMGEAH